MASRLLELEQKSLFGAKAILTSLVGHEEISRPFEFFLTIASPLENIQPEQVIGQPLGVRIDRGSAPPRHIHGFITHLWAGDAIEAEDGQSPPFRTYRVRIAPWLWFMTRAARCFVYLPEKELKTVQEVLDDLLKRVKEYAHVEPTMETTNAKILQSRTLEHCVQYRETDYSFLARTLERFGIYYFFRHTADSHTMVLSDQSNYPSCVESEVKYPKSSGGQTNTDIVTSWEHAFEFVSGRWEQTDYDPMQPSTDLRSGTSKHEDISLTNNLGYELFDYSNDFANKSDGETEAERRMQEEETRFNSVMGSSSCKTFSAGHAFKLIEHHSVDTERAKSYVLTHVSHSASQPGPFPNSSSSATYSNQFTCIPRDTQYRPPRLTPQPFLPSVQTAVVVGPEDEEIHVDKFARIKVKFHWDRNDEPGEHHSCWLRVSQVHAGKGFGAIDIPRVGEEVIVSFIDGSPDRPIVTGRVYNKEAMPPFPLPDEKTRSGIKTKTYKGQGFNELTMDDRPGKQQLRLHAERDMDATVKRNRKNVIHANDSTSVGGSQTVSVGGNQSISVKKDRTVKVEGDFKETVTGKVTEAYDNDLETTVANNVFLRSTNGTIRQEAKAGEFFVFGMNKVEIKSDTNAVHVIAATEIKLSVGANSITIDTTGIKINGIKIDAVASAIQTIKGSMVKINC